MKTPGWSPFAWLLFDLQRTITVAYIRQRWTRAALIVISIALGVSILIATRALSQNLNKAAQGATNPLSAKADLLIVNGQSGVPLALADQLRDASESIPELRDVQPMVLGRVAIPELDNRSVLMLGLQPPAKMGGTEGMDLTSLGVHVTFTVTGLELAQLLLDRHPVLLRKELAAEMNERAADFHVQLAGREVRVGSVGTVEVRGEVGLLEKDTVFMYLGDAAGLVYPDRPEYVTQINISLRSRDDVAAVQERLQQVVPVPCKVETLDENMEGVRDITAGLEGAF